MWQSHAEIIFESLNLNLAIGQYFCVLCSLCFAPLSYHKCYVCRRRMATDANPSPQMESSMLQQVVPRQESISQSRTTALQNVESTISELSGVFTHLATMVAHQGELAIRYLNLFPCITCAVYLSSDPVYI